MKESITISDKRVQKQHFSFPILISTFVFFGVFTTIQMKILSQYIDHEHISAGYVTVIIIYWMITAAIFTFVTNLQINLRYDKPMRQFAQATRQVANGDFSVYMKPRHTAEKLDYLDVMFLDFNKMVEELGSIETLKTDFFSNVSHEFKTPLAVIQNYSQMLAKETIDKKQQKEYAAAILQSTRRLSALITNLLKLNKLEKQTIQPKAEPYDLCRQLCDCALGFEDAWEKKGLEFVTDIEDTVTIYADENLMEIVWNNLLSNAIKFTEAGGKITLNQTSTENMVCVTISDTGCGMNEETVKHIFDKFYQGDSSHSTEGNGLGLALALRIIQLSGFSLTVSSKVNEGSVFAVSIPITQGEQAYE